MSVYDLYTDGDLIRIGQNELNGIRRPQQSFTHWCSGPRIDCTQNIPRLFWHSSNTMSTWQCSHMISEVIICAVSAGGSTAVVAIATACSHNVSNSVDES